MCYCLGYLFCYHSTHENHSCIGRSLWIRKSCCCKSSGERRQLEPCYRRLPFRCYLGTQRLGGLALLTDKIPDPVAVRTFPAVLGFGAGLAIAQGVFDYTGGKFSGYDKDPHVDEYERKEAMRKIQRRPIQETLDQLGEGRGKPPIQLLGFQPL